MFFSKELKPTLNKQSDSIRVKLFVWTSLIKAYSGLKINKKFQSQFCDRIQKFSRNLANFSRRIFALHFPVSGLAKQNMSPHFLCVKETAENGE